MHFLWFDALLAGGLMLVFTVAVHGAHLHGQGHPRPHFHLLQKVHHHLGVAFVCAVVAGLIAGAAAATGYTILYGPHGLLEPPSLAQQPHGAPGSTPRHMGLVVPAGRQGGPATFAAAPLPASVDLSAWAPRVGDQGQVNACASWAVGYGLASFYAARAGRPIPQGGAPMYLFSQATHGQNQGTTFPAVFRIAAQRGVDSQANYRQGNYNYWRLPTPAEHRNAGRWRSAGFRTLFLGQKQGSYARQAIEAALASGNPVTIGIPVYDNVMRADRSSYYIKWPSGPNWGGHALVLYKYDQNGVWAEGSWGTDWGLYGWVELSWPFVERYALEADMMVPLHRGAPR